MFARIMGLALLVGCGLAMLGERATPADEKPTARKIVIGVDRWIVIEAATKKLIQRAAVADDNVVSLAPGGPGNTVRYYMFGDGKPFDLDKSTEKPKQVDILVVRSVVAIGSAPTLLGVGGMKVGKTILTLTDEDNKSERIEIEVRREVNLPTGITYTLPPPLAKAIQKVGVDDARIITASKGAKGETVQIESLAVGETTLRLTDSDGKSELVVVQVRKPTLMLNEGEHKKIQMMKKQILAQIGNDNDRVLKVRPIDPSTVEIEAIGPGISNLVLVDGDKTQEKFEVGVKSKGK